MAPPTDAAVDVPAATQPLHILPPPFTESNLELLTQGAEALVYKSTFLTPNTPCALKYRPPKPYRHPTLDRRLTKQRTLAEARVLVRCRKDGISVPAVLGGDYDAGWLVFEWIEGKTIRRVLDEWVERVGREKHAEGGEAHIKAGEEQAEILGLMARIGRAVGKLHETGIVHGDLTTSNLMLRPPTKAAAGAQSTASPLDGDVVLIDFGLAAQSVRTTQEEEGAVDLYVLERAFAATHPSAEPLFQEVLRAYGDSYKGAKITLKRLDGVRLRGRKRSMLG